MKRPVLVVLILFICFLATYALSFFTPYEKILVNSIAGAIPGQSYSMIYSFIGGFAQSAKCNPSSRTSLTEPKAIFVDNPQNLELVDDATLRIYLLVTCGNSVGRNWKIKVNDYTVYESTNCFDDWSYLDVSFPSSYLHNRDNGVSLECEPTSSGTYYISLGKVSEGNTEFFKTIYSLKNKI